MSKKTNGIQVGNFIVTRDNGSEHDWISIKAVSGFWSMRFRDDNGMFSRIRELANNKELREYLETWIKVCFLISNATPMLSLWKSFLKATLILPNGYEACRNQYHRKMMPKYWKKKET